MCWTLEMKISIISLFDCLTESEPSIFQLAGGPSAKVEWVRCRNFKRDILSLNLKEWSVEDAKRHPVLHRTVDKATVEMVHLPDIFIQVSVHCINCLIRLFLDISKKF